MLTLIGITNSAPFWKLSFFLQDVMLSGTTNTQSPMSSVFTLPTHTMSLPAVSMATALASSSFSGSGIGSLQDSLFLSALSNMSNDAVIPTPTPEVKAEPHSKCHFL